MLNRVNDSAETGTNVHLRRSCGLAYDQAKTESVMVAHKRGKCLHKEGKQYEVFGYSCVNSDIMWSEGYHHVYTYDVSTMCQELLVEMYTLVQWFSVVHCAGTLAGSTVSFRYIARVCQKRE